MSNLIEDLHPCFQPIALAILSETQRELEGIGTIHPAVTFRSLSEQAAAKAAGLSQVSIGWHQVGLALDVAIVTPGGSYVSDGADPRYGIFGRIALAHDCIWGGSWVHQDYDHAEWHPGFTLQQYLSWLTQHAAPAGA